MEHFGRLFKFIAFVVVFGVIVEFMLIELNPRSICVDSKPGYYSCKPFGIKIQKPEPRRRSAISRSNPF